jgi:hypothetical protein
VTRTVVLGRVVNVRLPVSTDKLRQIVMDDTRPLRLEYGRAYKRERDDSGESGPRSSKLNRVTGTYPGRSGCSAPKASGGAGSLGSVGPERAPRKPVGPIRMSYARLSETATPIYVPPVRSSTIDGVGRAKEEAR